jgi:hypothetical protein
MLEIVNEQTKGKKAVIVVLISLVHEARNKSDKEIEAEIRKVLKNGLSMVPWLRLENIVVVEE